MASAEPLDAWEKKEFDDSAWKNAMAWLQKKGPEETPVLNPWIPDSVKALRKTFDGARSGEIGAAVRDGAGTYEMFLNGKRVGNDFMAPGWTDYREQVMYQTYDVTDTGEERDECDCALLAPGWYATPLEWLQQPNNYGDTPPALRAQLRIEHDGRQRGVGGDGCELAGESVLHSAFGDL